MILVGKPEPRYPGTGQRLAKGIPTKTMRMVSSKIYFFFGSAIENKSLSND